MTGFISALADASTMWLVCLTFIVCLIPLAIFGGLVYGMRKLLKALPPVLEKGQTATARVAAGADSVSNKVAAPFIAASALGSRVKETGRSIRQLLRRNT
jgi:hypothetical protein